MQLSHTPAAIGAAFDDPNLIASAGLVPLIALAEAAGLPALVAAHVLVPTDKGANADLKTMSLVAGMCAGADSIQDMSILFTRALGHCAMGKTFDYCYAPSTLGSFLRQFPFGHVRQRARSRPGSSQRSPRRHRCSPGSTIWRWSTSTRAIIEVHGHGKQGASFGYTGVRGLNASAATVNAPGGAPVIVATRLRKGSANSAKGAERTVADALGTVRRLRSPDATGMVLLRADSAYYGRPTVLAAVKVGAKVSVTVRQNTLVQRAIESIPADAWSTIEYPNAIRDEDTGVWVSRAEVAEIPFTAFASATASQQVPGRLVVRRIPDLNPPANRDQASLFDVWRFHAFFTTVPTEQMDTVAADRTHRGHAIIEQVFADLLGSALAHLLSGRFNANAAWLVLAVIAFNARPGRWDHRRRRARQGNDRHDPPAHLRHPRQDRDLRQAHHPPPANRLAMEGPLAGDLRCDARTTSSHNHLIRRRPRPNPTPRGTSRKNRHPEINRASDRTRARKDNQTRRTSPIGGFRLRFDGFTRHNSLFPYSSQVAVTFECNLAGYAPPRGSIHFDTTTPFPAPLLRRIQGALRQLPDGSRGSPATRRASRVVDLVST